MSLVLVTGATGYIGQHIIDQLLERNFKVVGTARSQAKADALLANFSRIHDITNLALEIVPDIETAGAFNEVLKNHRFDYVIHTASPISFGAVADLYDFYVKPAVAGCENILQGVRDFAPSVKHVVVTSSFASVMRAEEFSNQAFIHTEETWNPMDWSDVKEEFEAYIYSKKAAELASRKFVEDNQSELKYKYTSVHPSYVFGPHLFASSLASASGSSELLNRILSYPPDKEGPFNDVASLACDVRDVALIHVEALFHPEELHNARLCTASGKFSSQSILDVLNSRFPEFKGKFPVGNPIEGKHYLETQTPAFDFSKTLELVGCSLRSLEETLYDAAKQYFDFEKALAKSES
ncbi:unnamed protein product [Kuraishia capsulata CBS 1993]|uniref:NAD-dependent epimerase/dehydratase domain-containing protein n=1 Tax=Kuraishia capsulata CBS 1993 TaxID=1382522 RepID=W6MI68_9ASCO|nr:uncharacterized protein KUCA_T00001791001 [Kuraishia capsulata CBS 1993]CDK25821.1 unnamed protein product [Kuraishia capsulata CBS 1993]